ncbi:hypothetical protein GF337_18315 [candidate division KSB1 bacterium]|nr:hypothetical protein [candidate division KSB1 bacterium]
MLKIILYILTIIVLLFIGYCVWILLRELMFRILLAFYRRIEGNRQQEDALTYRTGKNIKMTNQWVNQHVTNIVINVESDRKKQQEITSFEAGDCNEQPENVEIKKLKPPLDSLIVPENKKSVSTKNKKSDSVT